MHFSQMIKSELENWDQVCYNYEAPFCKPQRNTTKHQLLTQIRTNNEMIPMIPPLQMSDN